MIGAARGYRVRLCVPDERHARAEAHPAGYGAELVFTDPLEGSDGAIREVAAALRRASRTCISTRTSTTTTGNWRAHYDTTAPEIIEQTGGRITHFVAGLGTSGTFVGAGRRLREFNPIDPADLGAARLAAARPRRPEAHGDGDRAGHLRPGAGRRGPAASAPRRRTS